VVGLLALLCLSLGLPACGTLSTGRGWGEDAIYPVQWARIGEAALHAAFDLQTLIPAAGAVVVGTVDHWDRKVSDWATTHHPLFGSGDAARSAADAGLYFLDAEAFGTALATPSDDDPTEWGLWKAKGVGVELTAELATAGMTSVLKDATNRPRPSGTGQSFPSGHASGAFSSATLANLNWNSLAVPSAVRLPAQISNVLLATGVGWARVEADAHYPSDVLAGAALGYFLSAFIHDAFMGLPPDNKFQFYVLPSKHGATVGVSLGF
jgi:membrane-associated phospholipid phosphatase